MLPLKKQPGFIMIVNMLIVMAVYMLSRWFFYTVNLSHFQETTFADLAGISLGGLRFDFSALCYLNIALVAAQFLPFKFRDTVKYQKIVKIIFLVINSVGIFVNVADTVYFEFGGRRTTAIFFSEFANEDNIGKILAHSILEYPLVWLFGAAMIFLTCKFYYNPVKADKNPDDYQAPQVYYPVHSAFFLVALLAAFAGLRGGLAWKMHPLRQDSADLYCKRPNETAIVLNTPFTIITTLHKKGYEDPKFFPEEKLDNIFYPVVNIKNDGNEMRKLNVVMFILEGFSREFVGFFNPDSTGYTPFLDSLLTHSYSFEYSFANGLRSVDCMPASLAGIPRYIDPYCYFIYSNNSLQGLPQMLKNEGYTTAFFHGAPNTTLGFKAFANSIGFEKYYGMDEYEHKEFFDGTWAIFDEPYLKYFAEMTDKTAQEKKPFFTAVFTASSHEPFALPDEYKNVFTKGTIPMHKTVSYADNALRKFFEQVRDKEWFENTVFVFTADHTGPSCRDDYNNDMGRLMIPVFFYTPGGQLPAKCDSVRLMQQTDITPSLLSLLNCQKQVFSFGKNIFDKEMSFINYVFNNRNGSSMYYLDTLMIEYRGKELYGIFDFKKDFSLKNNLIDKKEEFPQLPFMEEQMRAIIQQYIVRMKNNDLTAEKK
jgi:phosphoglycerol transferase MdoB-like AlkP superfamily enzyme